MYEDEEMMEAIEFADARPPEPTDVDTDGNELRASMPPHSDGL